MPKPINNDLSIEGNVKASLGAASRVRVRTRVPDGQSNRIFKQVTNNLKKNPNHSRPAKGSSNPPRTKNNTAQTNNTTVQPRGNNRGRGNGNQTLPPGLAKKTPPQPPVINTNPPLNDEQNTNQNQTQTNQPNINQTQNQTTQPNIYQTQTTQPNLKQNQNQTAQPNINKTTTNRENPPLNQGTLIASQRVPANSRVYGRTSNQPVETNTDNNTTLPTRSNSNQQTINTTQSNLPAQPPRAQNNTNQTVNRSQTQNQEQAPANNQSSLSNKIFTKVLQDNDIYFGKDNKFFNNNAVNYSLGKPNYHSAVYQKIQPPSLPPEINALAQNVVEQISIVLNNINPSDHEAIRQAVKEISQRFQEQIETAKEIFLKNPELCAKHFKHLNIDERMETACELMPPYFPVEFSDELLNFLPREILSGLLLARGLIAGQENTVELRNLIAFQPQVLPPEISLTGLRDVGQFVKMLISDAAVAKSTANLDLAVQKFVRLLIANNELGVLLATINLAAQTRNRGALLSRTLALVKIYELITRLLIAGEKAMKNAAKDVLPKAEKSDLSSVAANAKDENKSLSAKLHGNGAESVLRQFLEFNPAAAFDNSASAFLDSDDARRAQKEFVRTYNDEINSWLKSGNHRFVSDVNFDKPIGVVVERSRDNIFTASKVRVVLVRDGSVQGWHFLKSFLVR